MMASMSLRQMLAESNLDDVMFINLLIKCSGGSVQHSQRKKKSAKIFNRSRSRQKQLVCNTFLSRRKSQLCKKGKGKSPLNTTTLTRNKPKHMVTYKTNTYQMHRPLKENVLAEHISFKMMLREQRRQSKRQCKSFRHN